MMHGVDHHVVGPSSRHRGCPDSPADSLQLREEFEEKSEVSLNLPETLFSTISLPRLAADKILEHRQYLLGV
jgi:hypothetical protein